MSGVLCSRLEQKYHPVSHSILNSLCNATDLPSKMYPLVNSGASIIGVTNLFLIGFEVC